MKTKILLLASLLSMGAASVYAEEIKIPIGQQGAGAMLSKPVLGMTMESVEADYGEPQQRFEAVGEPPISRWQYPDFTVYFEHDTVMHSVIKHNANVVPESGEDDINGSAELQSMQ